MVRAHSSVEWNAVECSAGYEVITLTLRAWHCIHSAAIHKLLHTS